MSFIETTEFTRVDNHMRDMGIVRVEEFANYTEEDLLRVKGFGTKSLVVVKELLAEKGLRLKKPEEVIAMNRPADMDAFVDLLAEKIAARLKKKRRWWRW